MGMYKCPECNKEITIDKSVCPNCGFPIEKDVILQQEQKKKKLIGIIMCIIGCVFFIIAMKNITDENYKFYLEHYEDCVEGYEENMKTANSMGGMFKSSYKSIASSYEKMAEDDLAEIWKYRGIFIVCTVAGIVFLFVGHKKIKKGGKSNGTDKMSRMQ